MSSLVGLDVGELIFLRRSRGGFIFETIVKLVALITNTIRLGLDDINRFHPVGIWGGGPFVELTSDLQKL